MVVIYLWLTDCHKQNNNVLISVYRSATIFLSDYNKSRKTGIKGMSAAGIG